MELKKRSWSCSSQFWDKKFLLQQFWIPSPKSHQRKWTRGLWECCTLDPWLYEAFHLVSSVRCRRQSLSKIWTIWEKKFFVATILDALSTFVGGHQQKWTKSHQQKWTRGFLRLLKATVLKKWLSKFVGHGFRPQRESLQNLGPFGQLFIFLKFPPLRSDFLICTRIYSINWSSTSQFWQTLPATIFILQSQYAKGYLPFSDQTNGICCTRSQRQN